MLGCYFGQRPPWIDFFVESCKWNPDVRWRFYTDCGEPNGNFRAAVSWGGACKQRIRAMSAERAGRIEFPDRPCGA